MKEYNGKKKGKNDPDYKAVFAPNAGRLSELLDIAKGPDRTMADFVKDCKGKKNLSGISEPTFSRIRNRVVNRPVSDELLRIIAQHSANPEEANYESLMRANGKVPVEEYEEKKDHFMALNQIVHSVEKERMKSEIRNHIKEIILNKLFSMEYTVTVYPDLLKSGLMPKSNYSFTDNSDFAICINGKEPLYWNFIVDDIQACPDARDLTSPYYEPYSDLYEKCMSPQKNKSSLDEDEGMTIEETGPAKFLFTKEFVKKYHTFFLRDAWEPERMKDFKNTFVFTMREGFVGAKYMLENAKLNTWVSLLLVDVEKKDVVEEYTFPNGKGKRGMNVFE